MQILQAILVDAAITVAVFRMTDLAMKVFEYVFDKLWQQANRPVWRGN